MKKWAILLVIILAVTCTAGYQKCFAETEGTLEERYQQAMLLFSQNRFAEAAAAFYELGGYEEAAKLTIYCKAAAAGEAERYMDAFSAFELLGDYKESKLMLAYYHGRLCESHAGYQEDSKAVFEDLSEAITYYQSILFFRDCEERIETCRRAIYDEGGRAEQAGDLQTAKEIYTSLAGYLDSGDRLTAVCGKLAEQELSGLCPAAVTWEQMPEAEEMIAGQDPKEYPQIDAFSVGKDADGKTAGYVISVTGKGFCGDIGLRIGYSPEGVIRGIAFTKLNETAGLGMNADRDEFKDQFAGKRGELTLVYYKIGENDQEIEGVTAATITSTAVVNAVNAGTKFLAEVTGAAKEPAFSGLSSETQTVTTAPGFGGVITVKMTLKDQTVTELTIETPGETQGLGQKASEEAFTGQFVGKKGPFTYGKDGIDAITNATITSTAVLNAINQAYTVPEDAEVEVLDSLPVMNLVYVNPEETEDGTIPEIIKALEEAGIDVEWTYSNNEADILQFVQDGVVFCGRPGFFGPVTVRLTFGEDLTIRSMEIDADEETPGLGQRVTEEEFTGQFIGKRGPFTYGEDGIDAIAGATQTCDAVLEAVNSLYDEINKAEEGRE